MSHACRLVSALCLFFFLFFSQLRHQDQGAVVVIVGIVGGGQSPAMHCATRQMKVTAERHLKKKRAIFSCMAAAAAVAVQVSRAAPRTCPAVRPSPAIKTDASGGHS